MNTGAVAEFSNVVFSVSPLYTQCLSFGFNHKFCTSCLVQFTKGLVSQADDREAKRDTPEEGELQDQRMEITIRNSPYTREDSTEDRYLEFWAKTEWVK